MTTKNIQKALIFYEAWFNNIITIILIGKCGSKHNLLQSHFNANIYNNYVDF